MKPLNCLLFCLWFAGLGVAAIPAQGASFRDWTGNVSGFWSNPNNWNPVGVPQNGDHLNFDSDQPHISMINDLPNLVVGDLWFRRADFVLAGNPLTVGSSIDLPFSTLSYTNTINCALILRTDCSFAADSDDGSALLLGNEAQIEI